MVSKARGNPPRTGWVKRAGLRLAAMVGIAAIASTGLMGVGGTPAEAATRDYLPNYDGWHQVGSAAQGSGYGTWAAVNNAQDIVAYCIQPNNGNVLGGFSPNGRFTSSTRINASGGFTGGSAGGNEIDSYTEANAYAVAYILNKWGKSTTKSGGYYTIESVHWAIGELGSKKGSGFNHRQPNAPAAVKSRANDMIREARANGGPYTLTKPEVSLDGEDGQVAGIAGLRGGAGSFVSGLPYTATISGPAVWASGGKTLTGTTGSAAVTKALTVTGDGQVEVKVEVTGLPTAFTHLTNRGAGWQDMIASAAPGSLARTGDPVEAALDFQPTVTTKVNERYLSVGDPALDTWTLGVESGTWQAGLKVEVTGHLVGPFSTPQELVPGGAGMVAADVIPVDANVVGSESHQVTEPSVIQAGADTVVPASGIYYWVVEIDKTAQGAAAKRLITDSYTDGFAVVEEAVIGKAAPFITTERESEFIDQGDEVILRDSVELTLEDGQGWPVDLDGEPGIVTATAEIYFDQVPHSETPAGEAIPGTKVGAAALEFTEVGTQIAEASLTNGGVPGFYTWVWTIENHDLFEDYTTPSWEIVETASVRVPELSHESRTREYNVVPGGQAFDTITIGDIPEYHGDFEGIEGWDGDNATATVSLYGPFAQAPDTVEVPENAPVEWSAEVPFENGTFHVGYDDSDPIVLNEPGHYVFVYEYAGDARIAPFASAFNDVLERVYVPAAPMPDEPVSVITRAVPEVPTGTPFNDEAFVTGNVPEGSTLSFALYQSGYFLDDAGKCIVPDSIDDAELVATFEGIEVDGPGVYASPEYTSEVAGCFFWVETLLDKDGNELHQGEFGQPGETTRVYESDRDLGISTKLKHDGDQETGPVVGDSIWDEVQIDGEIRLGDYTYVDLYIWDESSDQPVCSEKVWTSERIDLVVGQTVYETDRFLTTEHGVHGFVETTYNTYGEIVSRGECGDPDETITVKDADEGAGDESAGEEDVSGGLASTGVSVGIVGAIAAILTGAGVTLLIRRKVAAH